MLRCKPGQLHFVVDIFEDVERRDPTEVLPRTLPDPIPFESHREFVQQVLQVVIAAVALYLGFATDTTNPAYRRTSAVDRTST